MKRSTLVLSLLSLALGVILTSALSLVASAQAGGRYDLTWSSVDGGGGQSSGNGYTLNGTIGQSDSGTLSGGDYILSGGLWSGFPSEYRVLLPLVLKVL